MSNYERSNEGPGGISSLPPTIGSPAQPYAPQYPAAPVYSAMPQYPAYPAMPQFPKRTGVLRGLAGLMGLGTEGTGFWSQPWFPYAALGALGVGVYLLCKSKRGSMTMNPFGDAGVGDLEAGPAYDYLMEVVNKVKQHPTEENFMEAWNIIGDTAASDREGAIAAQVAAKSLTRIALESSALKSLEPPSEAVGKMIPSMIEMGVIQGAYKPDPHRHIVRVRGVPHWNR